MSVNDEVKPPAWVKCPGCGKVKIPEMFDSVEPGARCIKCVQSPPKVRNSRSATAAYRERTGGAYDKAYNKATRLAVSRLKDKYAAEWDQLLAEAKKEMGI